MNQFSIGDRVIVVGGRPILLGICGVVVAVHSGHTLTEKVIVSYTVALGKRRAEYNLCPRDLGPLPTSPAQREFLANLFKSK